MKRVKTLILLMMIAAPLLSKGQDRAAQKMKKMEWLLGHWTRTNAAPGKSGYELWTRTSPTEWRGRGISMKGADTTFVEKLKIVIEKGSLWYVADVPENKKLVYFEITTVTPDSFTCENPNHDFPKKIAYQFNGSEIHTRVSAGDKGIDYVFVRSK